MKLTRVVALPSCFLLFKFHYVQMKLLFYFSFLPAQPTFKFHYVQMKLGRFGKVEIRQGKFKFHYVQMKLTEK